MNDKIEKVIYEREYEEKRCMMSPSVKTDFQKSISEIRFSLFMRPAGRQAFPGMHGQIVLPEFDNQDSGGNALHYRT